MSWALFLQCERLCHYRGRLSCKELLQSLLQLGFRPCERALGSVSPMLTQPHSRSSR